MKSKVPKALFLACVAVFVFIKELDLLMYVFLHYPKECAGAFITLSAIFFAIANVCGVRIVSPSSYEQEKQLQGVEFNSRAKTKCLKLDDPSCCVVHPSRRKFCPVTVLDLPKVA